MIFPGRALRRRGYQNNPADTERAPNVPDVGPPVTLDLGDVGQTTDRKPEELPLQGSGDRLSNRRLSNTRRTNETYDLAFHGSAKLSDSQELQNSVLNVLQSVVVLIQDALGIDDRVVFLGMLTPRDLRTALNISGFCSCAMARTWVIHSK